MWKCSIAPYMLCLYLTECVKINDKKRTVNFMDFVVINNIYKAGNICENYNILNIYLRFASLTEK